MPNLVCISQFSLSSFRNFDECCLELASNFNLFYGENGSGKTSLLEGLYCVATAKSFRTHLIPNVIRHHQTHFLLTATITAQSKNHFIGLERSKDGEKTIKLDGEPLKSIAPITRLIPMQVIGVDSYRFFSDGPKERRAFLDWGLFHVKHEFLTLWQHFNRVLKHRNAALKMKQPQREVQAWNPHFSILSEQIHELRVGYLDAFNIIYAETLKNLLQNDTYQLELRYKKGWSEVQTLSELLEIQFSRDLAFGHTQHGPHRADVQLYVNGFPADDILSQGQQKVAAYALHLAQGILLKNQTGQSSIYLIDDLPSELDQNKRNAVINILKSLNSQVMITSISKDDLASILHETNTKVFHVEHGVVKNQ